MKPCLFQRFGSRDNDSRERKEEMDEIQENQSRMNF
jgi:hypothetical protein